MDDASWVQIIANMGFPIGVTLYLLLRFEKKIDVLSESIVNLIEVIKRNSGEGRK
ncbi:YvrJ family protein [Paenibacillus massiliensis]|uniref:YvrJ family protein n=1 Tax=Paenibacillus massiliensis TaxID=225917 RepID=UPI000A0633A8|nr:YvrJ family protein [Paenibacillus massiliensis]